jgi:hypothetical protein
MSGRDPSEDPPALNRSPRLEVGARLGELVAGDGEDVVVVVRAVEVVVEVVVAVGEDVVVVVGVGEATVVVVGVSVVVCCAPTVGGASHAARRAMPLAKTARVARANFSRICVRSVTSADCAGLTRVEHSVSVNFAPQRSRTAHDRKIFERRLHPLSHREDLIRVRGRQHRREAHSGSKPPSHPPSRSVYAEHTYLLLV